MKKPTVKLAESRMYTVQEAADFFSMSRSWIRERVQKNELEGYLCGNLLISGASINRYLASRAVSFQSDSPTVAQEFHGPPQASGARVPDPMAKARAARIARLASRPAESTK